MVAIGIEGGASGRFSVLLSVVVVMLLGIVASWRPPIALAQEATPAAEEMAGVTFEPLSFALGIDGQPLDLQIRIGIEPGTVLPNDANDPSLGIVVVESGTLTVQLIASRERDLRRGPGRRPPRLRRPPGISAPAASITPGEAVTLKRAMRPTSRPTVEGRSRTMAKSRSWRWAVVLPPGG